MKTKSGHPRERDLSLYVSGDLGWRDRVRVLLHLRNCARCASCTERHRAIRDGLLSQKQELPYGVEWENLSVEMHANIRVGLEAGRVVELPAGPKTERGTIRIEGWQWRMLAVASAVLVTMVSGLYLQRTHSQPASTSGSVVTAQVSMESSAEGLRMQDDGSAMTLLAPAKQDSVRPRQMAGGLQTAYVDAETGQVTLHRVYADNE